jgi:serine/threonine-protein kinase SRK2
MSPHVTEPKAVRSSQLAGYQCVKYINRGGSGFVMLALDEKQKPHALKFMPLEYKNSKYVEREIINQLQLKHPHIIKLEKMFITEEHLVLVLEYANKGSLFSLVHASNGLQESDARKYFQQLILAVDFCHRMGVTNRDIKLENLLLSQPSSSASSLLKLSDFGFSKNVDHDSAPTTRLGTLMYIAPEVMMHTGESGYDARQADVWSCGVVLYVMLTARYPFKNTNDFENTEDIWSSMSHEAYRNSLKRLSGVSDECNDLLVKMLDPDPMVRLQIVDVMDHAWFQKSSLSSKDMVDFNTRLVEQLKARTEDMKRSVAELRNMLHQDDGDAKSSGDGAMSSYHI